MVAAPALHQRDGAGERRTDAGAEVPGEGFDVERSLLLNHALLYNARAGQARVGPGSTQPASPCSTRHVLARPAAFIAAPIWMSALSMKSANWPASRHAM